MMISVKRLRPLLKQQGFDIAGISKVERSVTFAREGPIADIFERATVTCPAKRGEAAVATVGVSVVRGRNAVKGLVESRFLVELADVQQRLDEYGFWVPGYGRAIIETRERAVDWERRFAETAPQQAAILARERGPELLASTSNCRRAAEEILKHLGDVNDLLATCSRLERESSADQRRKARRLEEWPGVLQIAQADMLYEIATMALVIYAAEITAIRVDVAGDPLHDRQLMWLIQILVDRIIRTTGWAPD